MFYRYKWSNRRKYYRGREEKGTDGGMVKRGGIGEGGRGRGEEIRRGRGSGGIRGRGSGGVRGRGRGSRGMRGRGRGREGKTFIFNYNF